MYSTLSGDLARVTGPEFPFGAGEEGSDSAWGPTVRTGADAIWAECAYLERQMGAEAATVSVHEIRAVGRGERLFRPKRRSL